MTHFTKMETPIPKCKRDHATRESGVRIRGTLTLVLTLERILKLTGYKHRSGRETGGKFGVTSSSLSYFPVDLPGTLPREWFTEPVAGRRETLHTRLTCLLSPKYRRSRPVGVGHGYLKHVRG